MCDEAAWRFLFDQYFCQPLQLSLHNIDKPTPVPWCAFVLAHLRLPSPRPAWTDLIVAQSTVYSQYDEQVNVVGLHDIDQFCSRAREMARDALGDALSFVAELVLDNDFETAKVCV